MTYMGPERRVTNPDVTAVRVELEQVRASMDAATRDLVTQESLNRTAKRAAQRLSASVVIAGLVIGITGVLLMNNINTTSDVAKRIESCTISTGECYKELQKNGSTGAVRFVTYMECILLIEPEQRTQAKADACRLKAGFPPVAK